MKTFDQFHLQEINETFTLNAKTVCMSHLSDLQEMCLNNAEVINRLNFVKKLIMDCKGDLNQIVDPEAKWKEFQNSKFYRK